MSQKNSEPGATQRPSTLDPVVVAAGGVLGEPDEVRPNMTVPIVVT